MSQPSRSVSPSATVLIVEDEPGLREGLVAAVERLGCRGLAARGLTEARQFLAREAVDCVLLDVRLKDGDGLDLLADLRSQRDRDSSGDPADGRRLDIPTIVVTAYGDSERTIRAMRDGAFDYITKPFELPTLLGTVSRALEQRALVDRSYLTPAVAGDGRLVGTSAAMLGIWKLIGRAAASNAPVLITGETGVGKELVARAIHDYSSRSQEPFVAVNLAALPPSLLESELFGHEKGAFTGAAGRRTGRFELAAAGTLFLDEVGDLELSLQTKLLRVIQNGQFERVGGENHLTARARVISATNKPVRPGTAGATLREDLYYRLAVVEIEVPPLRSRRGDIPLLIAHALARTSARAISEAATERLTLHDWPGNVRELFHVIERAAVLCGGELIDVPHLPPAIQAPPQEPSAVLREEDGMTLHDAVADLEKRLIVRALARANGNRSEAARRLGVGRTQLYAKMQEYGIDGRGE